MSNIVLVTDEEILCQRKALKGTMRHDKDLSNKYQIMNLNKYDVFLAEDTKLSSSAYNNMRETTRKRKQKLNGRGKRN